MVTGKRLHECLNGSLEGDQHRVTITEGVAKYIGYINGHDKQDLGVLCNTKGGPKPLAPGAGTVAQMTPQQLSSLRRDPMRSLLPVDQDGSSSTPFSLAGHEPWQESADAAPATAPFHFEHFTGSLLAPEGMDFAEFDGIGSALPKIHRANSFIQLGEADGFYLPNGVFDASLQYGLPKASPSISGGNLLAGPWNPAMNTAAERPGADLSFITNYEPLPLAPSLDNYEAVLEDFEPRPIPREQRLSASPSQYSSATGSFSVSAAAVDVSRRSSIVYSSHSAVSNSIEQSQSDIAPIPVAAAAAAAELPSQDAEAIAGISGRGQSVKAAEDRSRKTRTRSAEASNASKYPNPSPKPTFHMVSTTDSKPFPHSPIPKPSGSNLSQVTPTAQGTQHQRNRRAAIKCREKTKAAMAQLEATERAVSLEHMELVKTAADLREEVLALKNELLLHGNCNCDAIQQYLRNAARSIGEGSSGNYARNQNRVAAWTNPPGLSRHHSFS